MHRHHASARAESYAGCCESPSRHHADFWGGPDHGAAWCCCGCCCHGHHEHHGGCSCGHDGDHGFRRRFVSRAERISQLEAYLSELRAEAQAVEEELARLRKSE